MYKNSRNMRIGIKTEKVRHINARDVSSVDGSLL
jgi:hypothetical protein